MKRRSLNVLVWVSLLFCLGKSFQIVAAERTFTPVDYVNPLMGTQSTYRLSTGNTYPAIARPWGMGLCLYCGQDTWV